ncbi:type II toxin-antitoxin system RelE/ParE family toxin [Marinomonas atlantica]|uniref:type II toxin-antitoxin system RelE/ParE family toxin n=1 Tax=Marinomonas atlantica TaxID=1806668 RepID=UPI00082FBAD7|nr:type II toxin-antitoxin system RelE/ParE family toxin [Marinomonas atlantica]
MSWKLQFYSGVEESILSMPPKIQARMIRLLELMERPHTEPMGDGLFEIRTKAQEGIGRGLFCYLKGNEIIVLHAFVKKSQKTPKKELSIAKQRQKEVQSK